MEVVQDRYASMPRLCANTHAQYSWDVVLQDTNGYDLACMLTVQPDLCSADASELDISLSENKYYSLSHQTMVNVHM